GDRACRSRGRPRPSTPMPPTWRSRRRDRWVMGRPPGRGRVLRGPSDTRGYTNRRPGQATAAALPAHVPDGHPAVRPAGGAPAAVRRERDGGHVPDPPVERAAPGPRPPVPPANERVAAGRGQQPAGRVEGEVEDGRGGRMIRVERDGRAGRERGPG